MDIEQAFDLTSKNREKQFKAVAEHLRDIADRLDEQWKQRSVKITWSIEVEETFTECSSENFSFSVNRLPVGKMSSLEVLSLSVGNCFSEGVMTTGEDDGTPR